MVFGYGLSYFFNDPSLNRRIDNTRSFGFNYVFHSKNGALSFNPGINYQVNTYHSPIAKQIMVHVSQHAFSGTLDVLLKTGKKFQLRVGLLFLLAADHFVDVSYTDFSSRGYYSNSEFYKTYSPQTFQTGANVGIAYLFKLFRREQKFNLKVVQHANSPVRSDFWMSKALVGQDTKVLSTKARPTMLVASLEVNLQRLKKKKTNSTAEE